jgi:hypothetical protein
VAELRSIRSIEPLVTREELAELLNVSTDSIGICGCGCGQPTPPAKRNDAKRGHTKGRPLPFLKHHRIPRFRKLEDQYVLDPETGCWNWISSRGRHGYGVWRLGRGVGQAAHRAVYERLVGPIPVGLVLDHLCRNPSCVNPEHVESVTQRENVMRGIGLTAQNAAKTHCPKGHEYSPENTGGGQGRSRHCKACNRDQARERRRVAS